MAEYGTSGAPTEGQVTSEQRNESLADRPGTQAAQQQFNAEEGTVVGEDTGLIGYVSDPECANKRFLVKAGTAVKTAMAAGGSVGVIPLVTREGDVWAKFINGVLVTDVPEVIAWCDKHPAICRRSDDPATKGWATLKELSVHRANRERLLDPSDMNADESFPVGMGGTDSLKAQAAKASSAGGQLVESAELSKKSAEQEKAASDVS